MAIENKNDKAPGQAWLVESQARSDGRGSSGTGFNDWRVRMASCAKT